MWVEIKSVVDNEGNDVKHNFVIYGDVDEPINFFHLFCLSVIRDLVNSQHRIHLLDEPIKYNFNFDEDDIEDITELTSYMSSIINDDRKSFDNALDPPKNDE